MPSIAIGNFLTFIALTAAITLLVSSFIVYSVSIRVMPEIQQLKNILDHVAAKANELASLAAVTNATTCLFIHMPPSIGNQQYWMQLRNDSLNVWLEGALGQFGTQTTTYQVFLPREISASGQYVGGYGIAVLECQRDSTALQLVLSYVGG
ncbi:MAG: hypothetical protein JSW53_03385 [Candidatus Bathyarchaeota archaeon]|nr:MAG: hypothetical protein JSW53_03385 [Candidatus Bathyarchaeota archaeon]